MPKTTIILTCLALGLACFTASHLTPTVTRAWLCLALVVFAVAAFIGLWGLPS